MRFLFPCLVLVFVLQGCQKHPKVVKKNRKRLQTLQNLYRAKVLRRLKKKPRIIVSCQPGSILKPEKQITLVTDTFLRKVVDPKAKTRDTKALPISFATSKDILDMAMDPRFYPLRFRRHIQNLERRRFLGVFWTESWQEGKAKGGKIVKPAKFKGWFALFALKEGAVKAQFPIAAQSTTTGKAWKKKGQTPNWKKVLRQSLSQALGAQTNKYLRQYCPYVTVDSKPY